MEEKDYLLIEAYRDGLLEKTQEKEVLLRIERDATFAAAFREAEALQNWLRTEPARQQFRTLTDQAGSLFFQEDAAVATQTAAESDTKRTSPEMTGRKGGAALRGRRYWWAAAAGIVALFAVVWLMRHTGSSDDQLYSRYALHTPPRFTVRGEADNAAAAARAEAAFKNGDYTAALSALEAYAQTKPNDPAIAFYRAVCLIETGHTEEARALLRPLAQGTSAWQQEAEWSLALRRLKEKNTAACREALSAIQPGEDHYEEARRLEKEME